MRVPAALVLLVASGCDPDLREGWYACADDSQCPNGWFCRAREDGAERCYSSLDAAPRHDGGSSDGGSPDGGSPDGGPPDGGQQDARLPDGGRPAVQALSAGFYHTCALDRAGAIWCWGSNSSAQLGADTGGEMCGSARCSRVPVRVAGETLFTEVTSGNSHTCALDGEGAAWCWGAGEDGRLGGGSTEPLVPAPAPVAGGHSFVTITAGVVHTCAIDADDAAWCWGDDQYGQLGTDALIDDCMAEPCSLAPVEVAGGHVWTEISAGQYHTCAIDDVGTAWCWGGNEYGQLGNGDLGTSSSLPSRVISSRTFTEITANREHTCALAADGTAWCWGNTYRGRLGNPDGDTTTCMSMSGTCSPVPVEVTGPDFNGISAGGFHTCAIDGRGAAWCWGENTNGRLGTAGAGSSAIPVEVETDRRFAAVSAGDAHTCALDDTREHVWCWGLNAQGQLGQESGVVQSTVPVRVRLPPPE